MYTLLKRLTISHAFLVLSVFLNPVYAIQVYVSVDKTTVVEGGEVTLTIEFVEEAGDYDSVDSQSCSVGLDFASGSIVGTASPDLDLDRKPTAFPRFESQGVLGSSSQVNLQYSTVGNDGVEIPETFQPAPVLVPDPFGVGEPCNISNSFSFPVITIEDDGNDVHDLTAELQVTQNEVAEGMGDTGNAVQFVYSLAGGAPPDSNCLTVNTTIHLANGTASAVLGLDYELGSQFSSSGSSGSISASFGSGSSPGYVIPVNLNILQGIPGDGDKTIELFATHFVNPNPPGSAPNSCPLIGDNPQKIILTIKDSVKDELSASISSLVTTVDEGVGSIDVANAIFNKTTGSVLGAECKAQVDLRVLSGGTAISGVDFSIDNAIIDLSSPNTPFTVSFLPGTAGDGDKTIILGAELIDKSSVDCEVESTIPEQFTITIKDTPARDLTGMLNINPTTVQESSAGNIPIGSLSFALPTSELADTHCVATAEVKVVGGTAATGTDFNFEPVTVSLATGENNASAPLNLDILSGAAGDGDKTIELEATFTSLGANGSNSCPLASATPQRQTITIVDSPLRDLSGTLSINPTTVQESSAGTILPIGSLSFTLPTGELADAHCVATAEVKVVGGTAAIGTDFNFEMVTVSLAAGANSASAPLSLDILSGAAGDGDKTIELEATFTSSGANGSNSCPLASATPQRKMITITDSPVKTLNGFIRQTREVVQEAASGSVDVGELVFELASGVQPDANCRATAKVELTGNGNAQAGVDFTFETVVLDFGNGDPGTKKQAIPFTVLAGNPGDGDKTVELKASFTSLGGVSSNSCPFDAYSAIKTVTITDDPYSPLAFNVSLDKEPVEGETVNVVVDFAEAVARSRSLAARSIDSCQVSATWTQTGTATEADYRFAALTTLTYSAAAPQIKIPLELLADDVIEADETFGLSLKLSTEGATESCLIETNDTQVITPVTLRDTTDATVATKTKEPEAVLDSSCEALEQRQRNGVVLTGDDKSFYDAQCADRNDPEIGRVVSRNFEPEEVVSQSRAVILGADRQLNNIRARLDKLRTNQNTRGFDAAGTSFNVQGARIPGAALALSGSAGDMEESELLSNSRWGVFANGEYAFGEKKHGGSDLNVASGERKFDFNSTGVTLGADYRFPSEKYFAGAALGYKKFDADFTTQEGETNNKGYNLSFYGTYLISDKSYLDALVSFGRNQIDSRRPVNNDGTGGIVDMSTFAIGNPGANEVALSIGGGYEFNQGEWTMSPYGRVDYTHGTIDAYTERASHPSATSSMFRINEQNIDSLTSTVGIKATRVISTSSGVFRPHASIEWKHEFKDRSAISGSSTYLSGTGSGLGVSGNFSEENTDGIDKDYFNATVGVSVVFPKGRSGYLNLESRFGDDQIKDTAVKAGFRWEF